MVRLVWRTDVHLSDQAPASRKDDWTQAVFNNLDQVKLVAAKVKADAVIDGGDFFHVKSPSRNSHALVRRASEHHADYPCPVYCVPGNHDAVYGDYTFLHQQPLGVLYSSGIFKRLYDEHEAVFERDGVKVRVVGIPYHGTKYDMERFRSIKKGDEDHLIVAAHVLASQEGGSMFEGEDIIKYRDLVDLDPSLWLFGHWHKDQGVAEISGKKFINIGSLTRGALTQDNMDRKPATVLLSFTKEDIKIQVLRLKVPPAEEVFDLDAKVRAEARTMTVDAFVASVKDTLISDKGKSLQEVIGDMGGVPEVVREKALLYVEQA